MYFRFFEKPKKPVDSPRVDAVCHLWQINKDNKKGRWLLLSRIVR